MTLPTQKTSPSITPENARILVYGEGGTGKTTLGIGMDPDHTLLIASEPGYGGMEVYPAVIRRWEDFLKTCEDLAKGEHQFKRVVVDTTDMLFTRCEEYVVRQLNDGRPPAKRIVYIGDEPHGKGWDALKREWRRIAVLPHLGLGVTFTSHAKEVEIDLPVGKVTKIIPTLTGTAMWVANFCEMIFLLQERRQQGHDQRVLYSAQAQWNSCKGRFQRPMPDPLVIESDVPLEAGRILRDAMALATAPVAATTPKETVKA